MTNEELGQEVKRLEEQITNLRIKILESKAKKKPYEVEEPEYLGNYYFTSECGAITLLKDVFFSVDYEKVYLCGLAFKTEKEAEQYDKERILLFKMHKWAEEYNGGWKPNWKDFDEEKNSVIYDNRHKKLKTIKNYRSQEIIKLPYFKSEGIAEQFIKEFGDEIKEALY